MSPAPPTLNPSQTVERIREIIVGRQLERLEHRISRLEQESPAGSGSVAIFEDRMLAAEAKLEALRENLHRPNDPSREDHERRILANREDIQQLAARIQEIAAQRDAHTRPDSLRLESKLGHWLGQWQHTVSREFAERDQRIVGQLRGEIAGIWESSESQLTRLQSRSMDREQIEERFRRIAAAARALAESALPLPTEPAHPSF